MSIFTGFEESLSSTQSGHHNPSHLAISPAPALDWSQFHTNALEHDVAPSEEQVGRSASTAETVAARIDRMLLGVVDDLLEGHLPALAFVDAPFASRGGSALRGPKKLELSSSDTKAAERFCRAMIVADAVQENKLEQASQTQRDLYYQLKSDLFPSPLVLSNAVKDVSGVLGAPREDLNVTTFSGKGKVAGSLRFYHPKTGQWQDCRKAVYSIPGDLHEIRSLELNVLTSHALVVEKDAVFGSLVEARIWEQFPVILITGSGMPDIATRAMLKHICTSAAGSSTRRWPNRGLDHGQQVSTPAEPFHCVGLVDWNPAGCDILLNYKYGNQKGCRESQAVAVPEMLWIGVHSDMLQDDCDQADMQKLSIRDQRRLQLLLQDEQRDVPRAWKEELRRMQCRGFKCEIETAYRLRGIQTFCSMLVQRMCLHMAI